MGYVLSKCPHLYTRTKLKIKQMNRTKAIADPAMLTNAESLQAGIQATDESTAKLKQDAANIKEVRYSGSPRENPRSPQVRCFAHSLRGIAGGCE